MKKKPQAATEVRRDRVRTLYVEQGHDVRTIVKLLRQEKLLRTRRNDSAERLIRGDVTLIDAEMTAAQAGSSSELARARFVIRHEQILREALEEFRQKDGTTTTETVFVYANGSKMTMSATRKGDRGGQRIRALQVAMRSTEALAKIAGIDLDPMSRDKDPDPENHPPFLGLILDLGQCSDDLKARIAIGRRELVKDEGETDGIN